jgi:hypothetical protein
MSNSAPGKLSCRQSGDCELKACFLPHDSNGGGRNKNRNKKAVKKSNRFVVIAQLVIAGVLLPELVLLLERPLGGPFAQSLAHRGRRGRLGGAARPSFARPRVLTVSLTAPLSNGANGLLRQF